MMSKLYRAILASVSVLLICTVAAGCGGEKPTASQQAEINSALAAQKVESGAAVSSGTSSDNGDVDGYPNCATHASTYHTIPATVIALVSPSAFASFQSQYENTEDFNIVKFVQVENISQADFTAAVKKEGLTDEYPADIIYSGDQSQIDDYYKIS